MHLAHVHCPTLTDPKSKVPPHEHGNLLIGFERQRDGSFSLRRHPSSLKQLSKRSRRSKDVLSASLPGIRR